MRGLSLLFCAAALFCLTSRADETPNEARALARFEKSLQQEPASAAVHFAYAQFLYDHSDLRGAIAQWRTAQLLDPQNPTIANSLGGAYLRAGQADNSARQFRRATEIAATVAAYHYNLGNVEFMLRRDLATAWKVAPEDLLRQALAQFREATRLSPNDLEYARGYAETFFGLASPNWAEAEAAWRHVLEISPQTDFACLQLARVSLKRGEKTQALAFLDRMSVSPNDALRRKLRDEAQMP